MKIFETNKLVHLIKKNWTEFLSPKLLIERTIEDAKKANYSHEINQFQTKKSTSIMISQVNFKVNHFSIIVDFKIADKNSVIVGFHEYIIQLENEELILIATHGTILDNA